MVLSDVIKMWCCTKDFFFSIKVVVCLQMSFFPHLLALLLLFCCSCGCSQRITAYKEIQTICVIFTITSSVQYSLFLVWSAWTFFSDIMPPKFPERKMGTLNADAPHKGLTTCACAHLSKHRTKKGGYIMILK